MQAQEPTPPVLAWALTQASCVLVEGLGGGWGLLNWICSALRGQVSQQAAPEDRAQSGASPARRGLVLGEHQRQVNHS